MEEKEQYAEDATKTATASSRIKLKPPVPVFRRKGGTNRKGGKSAMDQVTTPVRIVSKTTAKGGPSSISRHPEGISAFVHKSFLFSSSQ